MNIIDKLAYYHQKISDEEKKKLLRTFPESFKPIAMVCKITQMSFNDVVNPMNAEIERQSNFHKLTNSSENPSSNNKYPEAY